MIARYAHNVSRHLFWIFLLGAPSLPAQPAIGQNGVVNRASQIPTSLRGGAIARGAVFTIYGVRFGKAATVSLQNGSPVRVLAVEPQKIDAIMPDSAPLGASSLVVKAGRSTSKPFPIEIAASNPGIFSQNKLGWGPGQIENINPGGKRILNSTANPAHPGQRVGMSITGLGHTPAAIVVVGNRAVNATIDAAGSPTGEQELSFAVPTDVPQGCFVPVYLKAAPLRASNVVTMAIRSGSGRCDPGPVPLLEQKRIGLGLLSRVSTITDQGEEISDGFGALFSVNAGLAGLSPLRLLPPPGTCTAYTGSFQGIDTFPVSIAGMLITQLGGEGLNAGPHLTVAKGNQRRDVPGDRGAPGFYRAEFESMPLDSSKIILSSVGGMDIGPFRVAVDGPSPFEWTGRIDAQRVDHTQPLPLHWRGQASEQLTIILARNVDQMTTANATCLCVAPWNATHFEIPAALLANIPATIDISGIPYNQMYIASLSTKAAPIAAAGIGGGAVFSLYANGRLVRYY